MAAEDLKAVSYDKTGRIRVQIEALDDAGNPQTVLHTLRAPTIGQFREIKDGLNGVREKVKAVADERGIEDISNPKPDDNLEGIDDISIDAFADVWRLIFNGRPDSAYLPTGLSDANLPTDAQRWPVWLLLDDTLIGHFLQHWRTVPLARSGT
jgi:hypothetical protein